ncbi:hypothetical protein ES703_55683 [subsurface metagenome]
MVQPFGVLAPHKATFRGVHNAAKTKVLMVLYDRELQKGVSTGLTARQLHFESGVNYDTLRSRLGKWHGWGYVSRRGKDDGAGRATWYYYLAARGKRFLEDRVPRDVLKRYESEIRAFRSGGV